MRRMVEDTRSNALARVGHIYYQVIEDETGHVIRDGLSRRDAEELVEADSPALRFAERLIELLDPEEDVAEIEDFESAGLLTKDTGLVVTMGDGSRFQITIVEDRRPRR